MHDLQFNNGPVEGTEMAVHSGVETVEAVEASDSEVCSLF